MTVSDIESVLPSATLTETRNEKVPLLQAHRVILTKEDANRASYISGVFNLSCSIVGTGMMSLPAAIKVLGVIPGVLLILVSGFLTKYSIDILLRFSVPAKASTYGKLVNDAFGRIGEIMLHISVVISLTGVTIIYLIIIADVMSGSTSDGVHHAGVLEEWFGEFWWTGRIFVLIFLTAFVLVPTTCVKNMDSLKFTSAIAVGLALFFIFIIIGITTYKLAMGTIEQPTLLPRVDNLETFWNLFTAVPVLVTSYVCHFNVHTIQNELQDPSQMSEVVDSSLVVSTMVYIMTGFFGFLLFGDSTASDILSNFDSDLGIPYSSVLNIVVRLSYALHIVLVFPVTFYALRHSVEGLYFNSTIPPASDNRRLACITVSLLLIILSGAILIPTIWEAFQLIGATTVALIGFIFPASVALRDRSNISVKRDKILSCGLIILSVFSAVVATYSNAASMF